MNLFKSLFLVGATTIFGLPMLFLVGCGDEESITEPVSSYILGVGSIEGPSAITLGDTLWITFTDIPMEDSCHKFHELEVELESPQMNFYRLWGKIEGESCAQAVWNLTRTIAVTNFEGAGLHFVTVRQPDDTELTHTVDIQLP